MYKGAIFDSRNSDAEMAFRQAIANENGLPDIRRLQLVPLVRYIEPADSWLAERAACGLAAEGVAAIFGPDSADTSSELVALFTSGMTLCSATQQLFCQISVIMYC